MRNKTLYIAFGVIAAALLILEVFHFKLLIAWGIYLTFAKFGLFTLAFLGALFLKGPVIDKIIAIGIGGAYLFLLDASGLWLINTRFYVESNAESMAALLKVSDQNPKARSLKYKEGKLFLINNESAEEEVSGYTEMKTFMKKESIQGVYRCEGETYFSFYEYEQKSLGFIYKPLNNADSSLCKSIGDFEFKTMIGLNEHWIYVQTE